LEKPAAKLSLKFAIAVTGFEAQRLEIRYSSCTSAFENCANEETCSPDLDPGRRNDMENIDVTLSESAAKRIAEIVGADSGKQALRVSVEGGGCSGFSYKFDLADAAQDDDVVIARGSAKVLIDSLSLVYMAGSEIDFVDNLLGQSFQIKNPNAVASCGCGTSFSV
jgi:iron-sulfur cluster assembly accessory protein